MSNRGFALAFLATLACAEQPADKLVGTWKLNVDKSHIRDIVSRSLKTEKTAPNTFRTESDVALKSAEKDHRVTVQICDGIERHGEGMAQGATEICRPDATIIRKQDGKVVSEMRSDFSPDGNTQTISHKKLDKDGNWVEAVGIYERQ